MIGKSSLRRYGPSNLFESIHISTSLNWCLFKNIILSTTSAASCADNISQLYSDLSVKVFLSELGNALPASDAVNPYFLIGSFVRRKNDNVLESSNGLFGLIVLRKTLMVSLW